MGKKQLTVQEKKLDVDLWIIALVTLSVFMYSALAGDQLMRFIKDSNTFVVPRLLVKKRTGNAWGCVFAFCFIWNAI